MCEYCRSYPHLPGCPNFPERDFLRPCRLCGQILDEEDLIEGICEACLERHYSPELGRAYAYETSEAFVPWAYGVRLEGCKERREQVLSILLSDFFGPDFETDLDDRPGMLRDYCLEEKGSWARFLKEAIG